MTVAGSAIIHEDGSLTPVDLWHWRAHYHGGGWLDEADGARLRGWSEVDIPRLVTIELRPTRPDRPPVMVEVPPGTHPVFGRRRSVRRVTDTGEQVYEGATTVLGWVADDGRACWVYVRDADGLVAISDREV